MYDPSKHKRPKSVLVRYTTSVKVITLHKCANPPALSWTMSCLCSGVDCTGKSVFSSKKSVMVAFLKHYFMIDFFIKKTFTCTVHSRIINMTQLETMNTCTIPCVVCLWHVLGVQQHASCIATVAWYWFLPVPRVTDQKGLLHVGCQSWQTL